MNIQKQYLKFTGEQIERTKTDYIVVHHTASAYDYTVSEIHTMHQNNGWSGIGYHYYIRKDGSIYEGRPKNAIGAHAEGYNYRSISVCLSGNFETETPTDAQIASLSFIIKKLRADYPNAVIAGHRELNSTACPGSRLFPDVQELAKGRDIFKGSVDVASNTGKRTVNGKIFAHGGKICVAIGNTEYELKADSISFRLVKKNGKNTIFSGNARAKDGRLIITAGNDEYALDSETVKFEIVPKGY